MKPVLTGPAVWLRTAKENRSGWNQKRPFGASTRSELTITSGPADAAGAVRHSATSVPKTSVHRRPGSDMEVRT